MSYLSKSLQMMPTHPKRSQSCLSHHLPTNHNLPTTLPKSILDKAQSKTTPVILSKMGYNRNMPKAVVYAPSSHGGLGLKHLHTEQGLQKALQVLKHLCTHTATGNLITTTLQAYQIQAGLEQPILEDTRPLPWMNSCWISTLRHFLQTIQGTIHLENPWTIPKIRHQDRHLMEDFLAAPLTTKELRTINNCRLHLQVTALAEISDHTGTTILTKAILQGNTLPSLQKTSTSKFNWPTQPAPGKSAWKLWTKTIQNLYV